KKKMRKCYELYSSKIPIFLGGLDKVVEADETVICRKGVIRYPTSADDEPRDTVWIFLALDLSEKSQFLLRRVKNRHIDTLTGVLEGKIGLLSIFHTDRHSSYPGVSENLCLNYKVLNHSRGFISLDGTHTNNIEGFWSHLKASMRKEHGVKRANIDDWLAEYSFREGF
ncbi:hypothetical protein DMUE_5864, partial [Dictyocoela muelleri]